MKLAIGGRTIDGRLVMTRTYQFCTTYGIPLDTLLEILNTKNIAVDWDDYITTGIKTGEKLSSLKQKVINANLDVLGQTYTNKITEILKTYV